MIGKVNTGAYFLGCIGYDLEDKLELSEDQKEQLTKRDGLKHKDRAEVLHYNNCFGDKYQLAEQFNDVSKLSNRVEKPVFHFSFSLAPGEKKSNNELIEMAEACAKEFEFDKNQYIVTLHKDTPVQHFHIIANRVGFDGKVAKDNHSKRRVAALCRRLEKQYNLKEVLSPRAFLPKEERQKPRRDKRKIKLNGDISRTLEQVNTFFGFEQAMKLLGYKVIKGRGIIFVDNKKVRTKGSDVGYSLAKIEKILAAKKELALIEGKQEEYERSIHEQAKGMKATTMSELLLQKVWIDRHIETSPFIQLGEAAASVLKMLMQPVPGGDHVDYHFMPQLSLKKKRKMKGRHI